MYDGPERRKHKRVRQDYTVGLQVKPCNHNAWTMVTMRDMSVGGVLFLAKNSLDKDTFLDLEIYCDFYREPIRATGKVIRVQPGKGDTEFRIAVLFTDIKEDAMEKIAYVVETLRGH